MKISKHSIERPVTVMMGVLIVIILGIISLTRIPIDLYPDIEIPTAAVITSYSGVGPEEIENLITKPVENAISTVAGLKSLRSTSREGSSMVMAEFDYGTDMDEVIAEMQQKLERAKRSLPDDVDTPTVANYDPNSSPVLTFAVSSEMDAAQLKALVEQSVVPSLEKIEGVASVTVSGGLEREIEILVDPYRLEQYGLTMSDISRQLSSENTNASAGNVTEGSSSYLVRSIGKFSSVQDIREISIPLQDGYVNLQDIAVIRDGYQEVTVESKLNGVPTVSVTVQKQSGTNTVALVDAINEELDQVKASFTNDIQVETISDQSSFIRQSIDTLVHDTYIGGILAMFIILFFLKSVKNTFIISMVIPISIISTFVLMYFTDMSINIMSLGGLTLGVGMIVDDAIVVLENIYRNKESGLSSREAAFRGTKEVAMPVIAATLTTVAVFLPIVFVEGVTSQLFRDMAVTVSFSLLVSLIVSLTLTPMLASRWISTRQKGQAKRTPVVRELSQEAGWVLFYQKMLNWALHHRKSVVVIAILAMTGGFSLVPFIGSEYMPTTDQGEINVSIQLPSDTQLETTRETVEKAYQLIEQFPEVETIFSSVGSRSGTGAGFGGSSANTGAFTLRLKDLSERERSTAEVVEELRTVLNIFPGARIRISEASSNTMPGLGGGFSGGRVGGMGGATPISYALRGNDDQMLKELAESLAAQISQVEGIREADTSLEETSSEVHISLDRKKAADLGIEQSTIPTLLREWLDGQVATQLESGGTEIDVTLKFESGQISDLEDIQNLTLVTSKGERVQVKDVATVTMGVGPQTIQRYNSAKVVNVTAMLAPDYDLGSVSEQLDQVIASFPLPAGYVVEKQGQDAQMAESFSGLIFAFGLAVALVYMILAAQFESIVHPLSIILSVPLSFTGALFSLWVSGRTISVPALIGVVLLAGIVVRNAIVLIDFTNMLRKQGADRTKAILTAGPIRLRPIIMTTLTTSLALFPLALGWGEGAESQAPMATVVVGGLIFSTLLTLIVIPVVYTLLDDLVVWLKKLLHPLIKRIRQDTVSAEN
ncbi:efflux RND transporter permease subunit [Brevibacillus humidisoli]|uniref:efflux RND transporter permease subunit n=1 Tax=Brevibacillus humidisoli TaxID=2895522 RepID=UPI001E319262|nr:efflux RND transporter permease subunit [Brevibacillus humidisoli]UFJ40855.1 efflux RND transporter permease subunit [Brevibacillus humidisoli]